MVSFLLTLQAVIFILEFSSATVQCWYPDGITLAAADSACSSGTKDSACCGLQSDGTPSICLSNGLCMTDMRLSRGSCTDQTWKSDSCAQQCRATNPKGGSGIWTCHDADAWSCTDDCTTNNFTMTVPDLQFSAKQKAALGLGSTTTTTATATVTVSISNKATSRSTSQPTAAAFSSASASAESISTATPDHSGPSPTAVGFGVGIPLGLAFATALGLYFWQLRKNRNLKEELAKLHSRDDYAASSSITSHGSLNEGPKHIFEGSYGPVVPPKPVASMQPAGRITSLHELAAGTNGAPVGEYRHEKGSSWD